MLHVDSEGTPTLVQNIIYYRSDMTFEITFFDGRTLHFYDTICKSLTLMQHNLSRLQWLEIEQWLETNLNTYWKIPNNKIG